MTQQAVCGHGAIEALPEILQASGCRHIFLVASRASFSSRPARRFPSIALGEWIDISRGGRGTGSRLFAAIEKILGEGELNAYDTAAFNCLARDGETASICPTDGRRWVEIDFVLDYGRAWKLFGRFPEERRL